MDTLGNMRMSVSRFVGESGMCPDDPRVLDAINEARRILYPVGNWECLCEAICVCPQDCGLTLPSAYEYIKTARLCNRRVVVENFWFSQISSFSDFCTDSNLHMVKKPGSYVTFCDWPDIPNGNAGCCKPDCPEFGFYLSIVLEDSRDQGVKLGFHGTGAHTQQLSVTRTIDTPEFTSSEAQPGEERFIELKKVSKPRTYGKIRVYGQDGANRLLLALYEPTDVNPRYARYYLPLGVSHPTTVVFNCKKRYIPLYDDEQFVEFNTDAMIHALQALAEREVRDYQSFTNSLQMAQAVINKEQGGEESTSMGAIQMSSAYRVDGLVEYPYDLYYPYGLSHKPPCTEH
jgi:hypothetical protein